MGLALYGPVLSGAFVSDDHPYIVQNTWIHELSWRSAREILEPTGEASLQTFNWAPLHLFAHALQWQAFGPSTPGWHVTNVVLHALAASLLTALFVSSGIGWWAAVAGGALFLVHPANVEAVAWIFQLKSILALCLALSALLLEPRRPGLAPLVFSLALLTKVQALSALPFAAVRLWCGGGPGLPRRAAWLGGWCAAAVLVLVPEVWIFQETAQAGPVHPEPWVQLRSAAALGARYLAMAATSLGLSAFHQPEPAVSPFDAWWLASLPLGALAAGRALQALVRRREEAAYWVFAAASFLSVAQVFAFLYPMADRYLYFILPGLLGGCLLVGQDALSRVAWLASRRRQAGLAALAAAAALGVFFAARAHERSALFRTDALLYLDSASHYPNGIQGSLLRARNAAAAGDASGTARALENARARGYRLFAPTLTDPSISALRAHPEVHAVLARMARDWIETVRVRRSLAQGQWVQLGQAYFLTGELGEAERALVRATEMEGPFTDTARNELASLRAARRRPGSGSTAAGP